MILKEQLKDFLKTGVLKNINYGITRIELNKLLGNTDWEHYTAHKDNYPSIYKYGRLEFYFMDKNIEAQLSGIVFQPISAPAKNGLLKCNYHHLSKTTSLHKAIEFLKTNNIEFEEIPYKWDKETKLLLTEGKVEIFFDCQQTPEHYVLHKAGRFLER